VASEAAASCYYNVLACYVQTHRDACLCRNPQGQGERLTFLDSFFPSMCNGRKLLQVVSGNKTLALLTYPLLFCVEHSGSYFRGAVNP